MRLSSLRWLGLILFACEEHHEPAELPQPSRTAARERVSRSAASSTPRVPAPEMGAAPPAKEPMAASALPAEPPSLCNEQAPQPFLMEAHFDSFHAAGGSALEWKRVLDKAVRYRTEQYGYVKGFGEKRWNPSTPADQARLVTFFGVSVSIHGRIAPALSCVESAIRMQCAAFPYQPYVLSGLRRRNTYLNGEISNHVYGIALDVDPSRNPCCGCVGEWRASERCQNDKDKFQRMEMPRCWVTQFERFGFYWLGHSKLEDTMHFEFLADPDQIERRARPIR